MSREPILPTSRLAKKRPNSIDVARLAEVSQATVSYVLSGRADKTISPETRARVERAAAELGYMPNRLADGILRGKTSTIGVLMPDFAHSFNSQLLQGIEETLAASGFRTLIAHNRNNPEFERRQVRMLMEHRVDGIVAVTDEQTIDQMPDWIEHTRKVGVPVVVLDDRILEGKVDTIVSDDVLGARLAVSHLIEQGHRRIAYLGGGDRASSSRDRRLGYRDALAAYGIEHDPDLIVGTDYRHADPDIVPLLARANPPTAVFAASDGLAGQTIVRLQDQGWRIPEDLAFVGYGDLQWAQYMRLSTVNQDPAELGLLAAKQILARIQGDESEPILQRLAPKLIVRRSSESLPKI
jgi:DNA-binding LacI/PurR family transcriptional regulator